MYTYIYMYIYLYIYIYIYIYIHIYKQIYVFMIKHIEILFYCKKQSCKFYYNFFICQFYP